jgi:hypothetical protein
MTAILLAVVLQSAEFETRAGAPVVLAWNYDDLSCTGCDGGPIVRFDVRVDDGPYLDAGLPETEPGTFMFSVPTELLPTGWHTLWVRACNASECSGESGVRLRVRGRLPSSPTDTRLSSGP